MTMMGVLVILFDVIGGWCWCCFFGKMRKGGGNPSRTRSKNDERKKRGTSIGNLLGVILNYF